MREAVPTVVRETARPVFLRGGERAALLLHGFGGTPREMRQLGERLHGAGFTVSIPRLPGHGTSGEDFMRHTWRDWLAAATQAYEELRSPVCVAGLSMGGDLAVLLASRLPIQRIALIAPALRMKNPLIAAAPVLRPFLKRVRTPVSRSFEDEDDRYIAKEYWGWRYTGPLTELLRLRRMALKALPLVRADTLTVIGTRDGAVPLSVLRLVEKRAGARRTERLVLVGCGHRIFHESCGEAACAEIARWFTDADGKGES